MIEIQKIELIYKVTELDPHAELTYEAVSGKIELLKILCNKQIITNEEFERHKIKLLTKLKDNLKEKLKS